MYFIQFSVSDPWQNVSLVSLLITYVCLFADELTIGELLVILFTYFIVGVFVVIVLRARSSFLCHLLLASPSFDWESCEYIVYIWTLVFVYNS